jgi:ribosome maturation factor RimP
MYNDIPSDLLSVVEPVVRDHGLEVVDAAISGGRGRAHLRVVVDTPQGDGRVLVDTCAAVSRELGHGLDANDVIPGGYMLEVTSPGVDRVLGREKDFERAVGRSLALETRQPLEGRRRFKGRLLAFDAEGAHLELTDASVVIPFTQIARATAFHPEPIGGKRR